MACLAWSRLRLGSASGPPRLRLHLGNISAISRLHLASATVSPLTRCACADEKERSAATETPAGQRQSKGPEGRARDAAAAAGSPSVSSGGSGDTFLAWREIGS